MITAEIKSTPLKFQTDPTIFSPNAVDNGTLAMLSITDFLPTDKVLDLGCGYGAVGILAARLIGGNNVIMCDISKTALACAKINAELNQVNGVDIRISDGFKNIPDNDFTLILSNPPYHADFAVPKHFIEAGYKKLAVGGRMIMVTKRLDWYKNKLTAVFGGVKVQEIDGYYVFTAEKRAKVFKPKEKNTNTLSKKLQRRQKNKGTVKAFE